MICSDNVPAFTPDGAGAERGLLDHHDPHAALGGPQRGGTAHDAATDHRKVEIGAHSGAGSVIGRASKSNAPASACSDTGRSGGRPVAWPIAA